VEIRGIGTRAADQAIVATAQEGIYRTIAVASGASLLGGDQASWETACLETNLLLLVRTGEMDAPASVIADRNYNVCMQVKQSKKMLMGIRQYAAAAVSTNAEDVLASAIELVVCWVIAAEPL
jgi:hypothetical protein